MKILFTAEFYEPHKGGVEEVVKQLAERLVQKGHQITVATSRLPERTSRLINGVRIAEFALSGNSVNGIGGTEEEKGRYQDFLRGPFDVIVNYAAQVWPTDLALPILNKVSAKKILIPCGYSGLKNPRFADYYAHLPGHLRRYDKLVYMSMNYQDKYFGDEHGLGEKAVLIPNGASAEEFLTEGTNSRIEVDTPHIAISVSNHYLAKGHQFVIEAFERMGRTDTTLLIIGEPWVSYGLRRFVHFVGDYLRCRLASLLDRRIRIVHGHDRSLVLEAYAKADLFLFGSAVECSPLVMYESFASRTAFITRAVGNVKDHSDCLRIVSTPEEMARVANEMLDDPAKMTSLTDEAFSLWRKNHTWQHIAEEYEKLFMSLHHA